eukprot:597634-Pleurochrysis_carterae.AAC.2
MPTSAAQYRHYARALRPLLCTAGSTCVQSQRLGCTRAFGQREGSRRALQLNIEQTSDDKCTAPCEYSSSVGWMMCCCSTTRNTSVSFLSWLLLLFLVVFPLCARRFPVRDFFSQLLSAAATRRRTTLPLPCASATTQK